MAVTPFTIVREDGSIDMEEYNRCIEFLQQYIAGQVQVSAKLTWANPYELNEDGVRSSLEILIDEIYGDSADTVITNRLLTAECFSQFRRFFRGFAKGLFRTIYQSQAFPLYSHRFTDGPGYNYNVFDFEEPQMVCEIGHLPYVDNSEREIVGFHNKITERLYNKSIDPDNATDEEYCLNYNIYTGEYDGQGTYNKSYSPNVYSIFYRVIWQHKQTSSFFYYSYCTDQILRHGMNNYYDDRLERTIFVHLFGNNTSGGGSIGQGFPLSQVATIRANNLVCDHNFLDTSLFSNSTYLNPTSIPWFNTTEIQNVFNAPEPEGV